MDFVEMWIRYRPRWSEETYIVVTVTAVLLFAVLLYLSHRFRWKGGRVFAGYILAVYLVIVFSSTVFTRNAGVQHTYILEPFWSYKWGIATYGRPLAEEVVLNCFLLFPVGLLYPAVRESSHCGAEAVGAGLFVSLAIEFLQLVLKRGLFELDDIFHNTLGVVLGYGIWKLGAGLKNHFIKSL